MSASPTREEFQRTIEAVEARMDARVARLEGRIDAYMAAGVERDKRIELLAEKAEKAAERAGGVKTAVIVSTLTVLIAVIGTYFAAQQSNISIAQLVAQVYQQGQQSTSPPKSAH